MDFPVRTRSPPPPCPPAQQAHHRHSLRCKQYVQGHPGRRGYIKGDKGGWPRGYARTRVIVGGAARSLMRRRNMCVRASNPGRVSPAVHATPARAINTLVMPPGGPANTSALGAAATHMTAPSGCGLRTGVTRHLSRRCCTTNHCGRPMQGGAQGHCGRRGDPHPPPSCAAATSNG